MPSIHDSLLAGYVVDGVAKTITLRTEPHQGGGEAFINVVFHGVVAYHFEGDLLKNIVFGIEEVPAAKIVGDGSVFAERSRLYSWPSGWDPRRDSAEEFLRRAGATVYELHCSYGMHGWVAAKSLEQIVQRTRA